MSFVLVDASNIIYFRVLAVLMYKTATTKLDFKIDAIVFEPTVVATDEAVPISRLQISINVLLGLLHGNIHKTVQTCQHSPVTHLTKFKQIEGVRNGRGSKRTPEFN